MKDDFSIKGEAIAALENVQKPGTETSIVDAHMVEELDVNAGVVEIVLVVDKSIERKDRFTLEDQVADAVEAIPGVLDVKIKTLTEKGADAPSPKPKSKPAPQSNSVPPSAPLQGVGKVIAVASGKGGVGKSTIAVNLALALKHLGKRVGLLDVDIYGPSLPTLLGVSKRPVVEDSRILPLEVAGLRLMSIGFLMEEDTPVIWRGPIVTGIIRQFLRDVDWSGIDYLIVDMPPGTGDAQLAVAQTVPLDGVIVVSTPSELALVDAARGLQMFETLNVDVIGFVENMSKFVSPSGEVSYIFGKETVEKEAKRLGVPYLGDIPIDTALREGGDKGRPIMLASPDSEISQTFVKLAQSLLDEKAVPEDGGKKKGLFSFLKG